MRSKIFAIFLVLVIVITIFAGPLAQKSQAVVVSGIIVTAVIAVMALSGITLAATAGLTASQVQDYISGKLNSWATSLGQSIDHLISHSDLGMTISGLFVIGTAAAQGINDFIAWLQTDEGITDNSTINVIQGGLSQSGQPIYSLPYYWHDTESNSFLSIQQNNGNPTYSYLYIDSTNKLCVYNFTGSVEYAFVPNQLHGGYSSGNFTSNQHYADIYYTVVSTFQDATISWLQLNKGSLTLQEFLEAQGTVTNSGGLTLKAQTISIPSVQTNDKYFLDVGALPGMSITDASDLIMEGVLTDTLDVSGEVAEEEPPFVIDGPVPVYGLKDVFPFCIPFDLYDFVSCLAADPVAPHFEWRLYVEDVVDYTFVIDLQQFETAAQILRTMFLLVFIVGLAMVTRRLIRS